MHTCLSGHVKNVGQSLVPCITIALHSQAGTNANHGITLACCNDAGVRLFTQVHGVRVGSSAMSTSHILLVEP